MSDLTSLKISREVRDRLAAAAKARGMSVRALLDAFSRDAVDGILMDQAARDMVRLRDGDPTAWARYVDEGQTWIDGTDERLDT